MQEYLRTRAIDIFNYKYNSRHLTRVVLCGKIQTDRGELQAPKVLYFMKGGGQYYDESIKQKCRIARLQLQTVIKANNRR